MVGPGHDMFWVSLSEGDGVEPPLPARLVAQSAATGGSVGSPEPQSKTTPEAKLGEFCMQVARAITPLI